MDRKIILVCHNLRSCHNVGSLLRTSDGIGIETVYLTGYTPYPKLENDSRLPHIANKLDGQIHKTALGAENTVDWKHEENVFDVIKKLKAAGYKIVALEQTDKSIDLSKTKSSDKLVIVVGREVEGIEKEVLKAVDEAVFIPMLGSKESYNVVQAAAMALYSYRFL